MMTGREDFKKILDTMNEISIAKNNDYAGNDFLSNFKMSEKLGVKPSMGCAIRISDKFSRICQLMQKDAPDVTDETIEDTLIDLANYCVIMVLLLREEQNERTRATF